MANKPRVISAQVVFRPASGGRLDRRAVITAENIKRFAPDPTQVAAAAQLLSEQGFQVSELKGNSLSITAPRKVFEKAFSARLSEWDDEGIRFVDDKGEAHYELPRTHLPKELIGAVEAITFSPPPEFGPREFMA